MHIEAEIKKWGNSLALRITGAMAEIPHLKAGTKVDIEVKKEALIIKPVRVKKNPKQREVIVRRYGLQGHEPCTLEEVGSELGVSSCHKIT